MPADESLKPHEIWTKGGHLTTTALCFSQDDGIPRGYKEKVRKHMASCRTCRLNLEKIENTLKLVRRAFWRT